MIYILGIVIIFVIVFSLKRNSDDEDDLDL